MRIRVSSSRCSRYGSADPFYLRELLASANTPRKNQAVRGIPRKTKRLSAAVICERLFGKRLTSTRLSRHFANSESSTLTAKIGPVRTPRK